MLPSSFYPPGRSRRRHSARKKGPANFGNMTNFIKKVLSR